jgi:hypothetical protein
MGRPIKKKFFGNLSAQGLGGEGVASVSISDGGADLTGTNTVVFSAPQLPGGVTATGSVVLTDNTVSSVTILTAGSGYTSTPTVVFVSTTGTTATGTVSLTTSVQNALSVNAFVDGGSSAVIGDIVKQESSKRYLVKTAQGQSQCKLVAAATGSLTEGQMNLIATDTLGSTYYVTKLTARKAVLSTATDNGGFEFAEGSSAGWTLGSASTGTVSIASV